MPSTIKIIVFHGNQPELLPAICMFCAKPLMEDQYQQVVLRVGKGLSRAVPLPICARDHIPDVVYADAQAVDAKSAAVTGAAFLAFGVIGAAIAHNMQERAEAPRAFYTFHDVHSKFAKELTRLRDLTPAEYEQMMAKANARFAAALHAGAPPALDDEQRRLEKEKQHEADAETFGLKGAVGKGEVAREVSQSSSMKFIIATAIVGVLSLLLLACISAGVIGYFVATRKPPEEEIVVKEKVVEPPKELQAKIKTVDVAAKGLKLLMSDNRTREFSFTGQTKFYDKEGGELPDGAAALPADGFCVILPTQDQKSLQWLKLTDGPR